MVFLVAAAILTASVVYDVKNRREMAAELEDWSEVKSRRIRKREKLFLAVSIFCFNPVLSCLPTGQYPPNNGKGSFGLEVSLSLSAAILIQNGNFVPKPVSPSFYFS